MIVARSFSPPSSSFLSEKNDLTDLRVRFRSRSRSPRRSTPSPSPTRSTANSALRSNPVKIPSRNSKKTQSEKASHVTRPAPTVVQPTTSVERPIQVPKIRRETPQEILSATAIPTRRRVRPRPSQRLPQCDHVADFSKLLLEDIPANKDASLPRHQSMPPIDGLFGNIDELVEGQLIVGSEGADDNYLSARSISSDSLASLASPDDYGSPIIDHRSHSGRSPQGRLAPRISHSEDCSDNHPLAELHEIESLSLSPPESTSSQLSLPSRTTSPQPRTMKKEPPRSSFKSTLTSSLKALKSAARTTILSSSGFGHHGGVGSSLYTNESLLAHNFFDIQPSLTDDRRPPPTMTRPSPELRRYLNPQMATSPPDSPTQLHFWQDERYSYDAKAEARAAKEKSRHKQKRKRSPGTKSKVDELPSIVPLSTCLPPTIRTANASSPPIWLTPDGEPINKNTSNPLLYDPNASIISINGVPRNREPRENRDFLRMYVGEMAMRRNGKLSDDVSATRAKLWLPPLSGFPNSTSSQTVRREGAERWQSWGPEDVVNQE